MLELTRSRVRALVVLVAAALVVLLGPGGSAPAAAHPFGDPQTLDITSDEGDVRLRWKVGGTDDLTVLAQHLDLLPVDRVMLDGAVFYEAGDGALLAGSPRFADYLLSRIRVTSGGTPCPGEVLPVTDLTAEGAVLSFDCGTGDEVDVEARTLTDLHPEYRTLATGPGGQRAVYDDEHPGHRWSLTAVPGATGGAAHSAVVQLGSVLGGAALVAGAVGFHLRRRGRRASQVSA